MKDKISSYFDLENFVMAKVSCILDPRFKNSSHEDKLVLERFMERNGVIVRSSPTEPHEKSMVLFLLYLKMIQILLKKNSNSDEIA